MKKILLLLIIFISFANQEFCFGQKKGQELIDSLLLELPKEKEDTNKLYTLNLLNKQLWLTRNYDTALYYSNKTITLSKKLILQYKIENDNNNIIRSIKKRLSFATNIIGNVYKDEGNFLMALKYYEEALSIGKETDDKKRIAISYNNIGLVNSFQGNFSEALKNQFAALKIREKDKDKEGLSMSYANIGNLYWEQGNIDDALKIFYSALKIREEMGDLYGKANSYETIGEILRLQGKYKESLKTHFMGLKINEEIGDKDGIAMSYVGIAGVYESQRDYEKALDEFTKALKIMQEIKNTQGIADEFANIGRLYLKQNKFKESISNYNKSLALYNKNGSIVGFEDIYMDLSEAYEKLSDYKKSKESYEQYIFYRDSLLNNENTKKTVKAQMQFEFEKKTATDSIKAQEDKKVISAELKQEQTKSYALYGGVALLLVFGGFMFNRFKVTQKQKNTIEIKEKETQKQKQIVEEKQREILDSIEYALRIQTAILPPQRIVKQYLENSFIVYKPKDIVAGDFYWMEVCSENGERRAEKNSQLSTPFSVLPTPDSQLILFAACDCTGHGVPGAMVSVVCHNALNRAVREFGLTQPAAILDKTAEIVIENFSKSEEDIKDGMDISLVSLEFGERRTEGSLENGERRTEKRGGQQTTSCILNYAGANNPLWIVRRAENSQLLTPNSVLPTPDSILIETKADKQPIGMNEDSKPFTNHTFTLNSGDSIYLFTDGFADQFGGESGQKKLTRKRFKELILSIQNKTMQEQGIALDKFITDYRKEVEQIDDILVMGVRI